MGADQHGPSANPYPANHTGRFAIPDGGDNADGTSAAAADTSQAAAGATGTAAFALTAGRNWRAVTVRAHPSAPRRRRQAIGWSRWTRAAPGTGTTSLPMGFGPTTAIRAPEEQRFRFMLNRSYPSA